MFLYGGIVVSSRVIKQALVATSIDHSGMVTLHEAARECVWLQRKGVLLFYVPCLRKKHFLVFMLYGGNSKSGKFTGSWGSTSLHLHDMYFYKLERPLAHAIND